jgi:hypothetical protein
MTWDKNRRRRSRRCHWCGADKYKRCTDGTGMPVIWTHYRTAKWAAMGAARAAGGQHV